MSDFATSLAALTSVLPWSVSNYVDSGDSVRLGLSPYSTDYQAILAGVDFWTSADILGAGQLYLTTQLHDYAFWNRGFPQTDYELAAGFQASYRGSFPVGQGDDVVVGLNNLGGLSIDCNFAAWGYFIPYGWSPVGLPAQQ